LNHGYKKNSPLFKRVHLDVEATYGVDVDDFERPRLCVAAARQHFNLPTSLPAALQRLWRRACGSLVELRCLLLLDLVAAAWGRRALSSPLCESSLGSD
jgi:hypothetical protein